MTFLLLDDQLSTQRKQFGTSDAELLCFICTFIFLQVGPFYCTCLPSALRLYECVSLSQPNGLSAGRKLKTGSMLSKHGAPPGAKFSVINTIFKKGSDRTMACVQPLIPLRWRSLVGVSWSQPACVLCLLTGVCAARAAAAMAINTNTSQTHGAGGERDG